MRKIALIFGGSRLAVCDGRWHPQTRSGLASPARIPESAPRFSSGSPLPATSRCRCSASTLSAAIVDVAADRSADRRRVARLESGAAAPRQDARPEPAADSGRRSRGRDRRRAARCDLDGSAGDARCLPAVGRAGPGGRPAGAPLAAQARAAAAVVDRRRVGEGRGRQHAKACGSRFGRLAGVAAAVLHAEGAGIRRCDEGQAGVGGDAGAGLDVVRRSHRAAERRRPASAVEQVHRRMRRTPGSRLSDRAS